MQVVGNAYMRSLPLLRRDDGRTTQQMAIFQQPVNG